MSKDFPSDARAMAVALVQRIADPSRGTLTNREIVTLTQAVTEDLEELDAIDPARVLERLRLLPSVPDPKFVAKVPGAAPGSRGATSEHMAYM